MLTAYFTPSKVSFYSEFHYQEGNAFLRVLSPVNWLLNRYLFGLLDLQGRRYSHFIYAWRQKYVTL